VILLLLVGGMVWMMIEVGMKMGGETRRSGGAILSLSLWRGYPGRARSASEVRLDWGRRRRWKIGYYYYYPSPSTIGPRPKREWIRRLQYFLLQHPDPEVRASLRIPPAQLQQDGLVLYPPEVPTDGRPIHGACSWESSGCLRTPQNGYSNHLDIIQPDPHSWVVNFDDGPLPPSERLYQILDQFGIKATHFWIGGNVLKYWKLAKMADRRGDHLAVHTWSHSHLTSLTNHQILGELGWTMQIIFDLTGKVPRFFRPPYGNIDNRVRAIAKHVFGLETVIWNFDSVDWGLNQTYATGDQVDRPDPRTAPTLEQVVEAIGRFASANSSSAGGLILQHELSLEAVEAFRRSWDSVRAARFSSVGPLPVCLDAGMAQWYQ